MANKINEKALSVGFLPTYRKLKSENPYDKLFALNEQYEKAQQEVMKASKAYFEAADKVDSDFKAYLERIKQLMNDKSLTTNDRYALSCILD